MVIALIGGAGSGKDTQARMLSAKYNIPSISTGQIIRDEAKVGNPLALEAISLSNSGKWAPDELVNKLLSNHIDLHAENGFIITGYPRTLSQAQNLDTLLSPFSLSLGAVFHLKVTDEVLLERMKIQAEQALAEGKARNDTDPEAMAQRLTSYHESIDPILEFYMPTGLLIDIDGLPSKEEVNAAIVAEIERRELHR